MNFLSSINHKSALSDNWKIFMLVKLQIYMYTVSFGYCTIIIIIINICEYSDCILGTWVKCFICYLSNQSWEMWLCPSFWKIWNQVSWTPELHKLFTVLFCFEIRGSYSFLIFIVGIIILSACKLWKIILNGSSQSISSPLNWFSLLGRFIDYS